MNVVYLSIKCMSKIFAKGQVNTEDWDHLLNYLDCPCQDTCLIICGVKEKFTRGFPGGAVVKNPPASAGDTGLSPDLGRSLML